MKFIKKYVSTQPEIELLEIFKDFRKSKNLSLNDVYRMNNIMKKSNLSRIERNIHSPTIKTLRNLANLIGCEFEIVIRDKSIQ